MEFSINNQKYKVIEVNRKGANGFAVFKCEHETRVNEPFAVAQSPIELLVILKKLFMTTIFKPYIKL